MMEFDKLIFHLEKKIDTELPGNDSHQKMQVEVFAIFVVLVFFLKDMEAEQFLYLLVYLEIQVS